MLTNRLRRFYLWATWTPLILPVLFAAWFRWRHPGSQLDASSGTGVGYLLVLSLLFGGIPYTGFAAWASRWLMQHAQNERQVRGVMVRAPIVVAILTGGGWLLLSAVTDEWTSGALIGGICGLYVLALGYAYVLATLAVRTLVPWLGLSPDELQ